MERATAELVTSRQAGRAIKAEGRMPVDNWHRVIERRHVTGASRVSYATTPLALITDSSSIQPVRQR
jgi:hypothetical protein